MLDEVLDGLALVVGEIRETVLYLAIVGHVGKEAFRADQVFVDIVEVGENDVAPEDELVKGLGLWVQGTIDFVKLEEQVDLGRSVHSGDFVEEFIDGKHLRDKEGLLFPGRGDSFPQILPEEKHRPAVRKNKASALNVTGGVIVRRHLFQEFHYRLSSSVIPNLYAISSGMSSPVSKLMEPMASSISRLSFLVGRPAPRSRLRKNVSTGALSLSSSD